MIMQTIERKFKMSRSILLLSILLPIVLLNFGCAGMNTGPVYVDPREEFESNINQLLSDLMVSEKYSSTEMAPAAVMPGSLKSGAPFTRLEQLVMERLSMRLRQHHDMYTLSRQNWFEFREGRPLTFLDKPHDKRAYLRSLIIYEVNVSADEILDQVKVHIVASNADGHAVAGIMAEVGLEYTPSSPAYGLYLARPATNPYPEGLEENPYESMDRLAFSLSAELADAYRTGITADGKTPAESEVRVLLYSKEANDASWKLVEDIQNALQQAIVSNRGFTCVVSQEDFGPAFNQVDFYRRNSQIFEMEDMKFTAGTVLLMSEVSRHREGDKVGVALRALWRVSPLESATGDLIPTNVSGTYLSGFTAKAYLRATDRGGPYRRPRVRTAPVRVAPTRVTPPAYTPAPVVPSYRGDVDICFLDFTDVFQKRIFPVLRDAPSVTRVERLYDRCQDGARCICYALDYTGPREDLEAWLKNNLKTSQVLAFKLISRGENRIDVVFDAGFE
jgi:hypothetical protein